MGAVTRQSKTRVGIAFSDFEQGRRSLLVAPTRQSAFGIQQLWFCCSHLRSILSAPVGGSPSAAISSRSSSRFSSRGWSGSSSHGGFPGSRGPPKQNQAMKPGASLGCGHARSAALAALRSPNPMKKMRTTPSPLAECDPMAARHFRFRSATKFLLASRTVNPENCAPLALRNFSTTRQSCQA